MSLATRRRVLEILSGLPNALLLSILTAATTIILALVISLVLGSESRSLQRQAVINGEEVVDHAIVARCELAHVVDILKEIGEQSAMLDLSEFAEINTEGLPCERALREPFHPGNDFGLEGP